MARKAWNLKKSYEYWSLRANLTLIEPNFGHWGPDPTPKMGSIWSYFLDLSLNPKLDAFFGRTNPVSSFSFRPMIVSTAKIQFIN